MTKIETQIAKIKRPVFRMIPWDLLLNDGAEPSPSFP
jgi:hypothetical protein